MSLSPRSSHSGRTRELSSCRCLAIAISCCGASDKAEDLEIILVIHRIFIDGISPQGCCEGSIFIRLICTDEPRWRQYGWAETTFFAQYAWIGVCCARQICARNTSKTFLES